MITFNSIGEFGRIGNQLFQYAAGYSLALHNNSKLCLQNTVFDAEWHSQKCLLK